MGKKLSAYNLYMRKALKGKMAGKTKAQRKAVFKAAARGWNKGKPRSKPRSSKPKSRASPSRRAKPTGGTRRMAKSSFNMNKIYGLIRKAAIVVPAVDLAMQIGVSNEHKVKVGIMWYFGWDPWSHKFRWEQLWNGWGPAVGAQVITRIIPAISKLIRGIF